MVKVCESVWSQFLQDMLSMVYTLTANISIYLINVSIAL